MAQSRFKSKIAWVAITLILFLWGWHFTYHNKALGFSVAKITSDFSYHPEWEMPPLSPHEDNTLQAIFSQPFYYLGAGSQSYAFVSEDGKTVLKFFRMKHTLFYLKDLWAGNRSEARKNILLSIYDSHTLAYQKMKQDAGLLYLHLNKTDHLKTTVRLVDRLHRSHHVDLDNVEFVLQEKAELIFSKLKTLLKQPQQLNAAIQSVADLIDRRNNQGLADHDKAVSHNFGFIKDRPIQIDVGRIYKRERPQDKHHILQRIDKWQSAQPS